VTCVVPAVLESEGPSTVRVAVSNNGHHYFSNNITFSYYPMEVVTAVTPPSLSLGGGTSLAVTGYNFVAVETGNGVLRTGSKCMCPFVDPA
jgi:hypothetical protein